jgi:hypothetical protein
LIRVTGSELFVEVVDHGPGFEIRGSGNGSTAGTGWGLFL